MATTHKKAPSSRAKTVDRAQPPAEYLEYDGVTVSIVLVDPETAQDWLDFNRDNRHDRDANVDAFARDMAAGRWNWQADPIRFSKTDRLLDGQHRLKGIIKSGTTQPVLLVEGLDDPVQDTMDTGAPRRFSDVLRIHGEGNTSLLSAVIRRLWLLERGLPGDASTHAKLTHAEMSVFFAERPLIRDAVDVAQLARRARLQVATSVIGAAWYVCAQRSRPAADDFFIERLINKVGREAGDAATLLERKFNIEHSDELRRNINPEAGFRYTIHAWNLYRQGRTGMTKFQGPKGGWPPITEMKVL
jgi:hypothetical protein